MGSAVEVEVKLVNQNLAHARGGEVALFMQPNSIGKHVSNLKSCGCRKNKRQ